MFPTLGMSPGSPLEDSRDGVEERERERHRKGKTHRERHTPKEKERHTEGREAAREGSADGHFATSLWRRSQDELSTVTLLRGPASP